MSLGSKYEELAGLGTWTVDRDQGTISWSPIMRQIHEVGETQLITPDFALSFFSDEDRQQIESALTNLVQSDAPYDFEGRITTAKGNQRWVRVTGAAERHKGKVRRLYGTVEDITRRKDHELEANTVRVQLQATLSALPDLLFELDSQGCFTDVFGGHVENLAVPPEDFIGKPLEEVLPPEVAALGRRAMAAAAADGHVRGLTYQLDVDGVARSYEISASHRPPLGQKMAGSTVVVVRDITARVQAEAGLRYRESLLSSLFDLSPIGIALNDLETGQFLDLNPAFLAPTGYTREEFTQLSYWDVTPTEYELLEKQALEDLHAKGRYGFEKEYVRKDGSRYPVSLNGVRVEDPSGRSVIWSLIEDISERRALENALRSERDQLRQLLDTSPSAIVRLDAEGRIVFANDEAEAVLGLEPSELEDVSFNAPEWIITSIDGGEFADSDLPFSRVMATGAPVRDVMHAIVWPDGRRRILSINAAPLTGDSGMEGVICIVSDISVLMESRERLRINEERLRLATHAAKVGIWSYNPELDRVYFSPECFELMGFSEPVPEMSGQEYRDVIHRDDTERVVNAIYACISGKRDEYREQIRHRTPDGRYIWTLAVGRVAERHDDGRTRIITGTFQDISAEKEYERLIAESRDAAEQANRAKSDFLANTSHEIRTPLNGVLGMAKLLARTELTEKQRFYVDTLCQSGQALLSLIENILDISRIEAGELQFDIETFDLEAVSHNAINAVTGISVNKGLSLELEFDPSLATMRQGDMRRLRQVLLNLLGNAVKFTDKGRVTLRVRGGSGDAVWFEVADTGIGLKADECEVVFSRFVQANSSNTRKHEGTGLGLAICKELVELAGGEISVESRFGEGSVFRFFWPLPQADGLQPDEGERVQSDMASASMPDRNGVVLIVEDNQTNMAVIEDAVRSAGYKALTARNGPEALRILESARVALVLMDLHMPGMSGEEAIGRIRAMEPPVSQTPIITLSADATAQTAGRLKKLDIQGSFNKPLDLDAVISGIEHWTEPNRKAC
ncbi:MAG: PAS domain S-box protein [Oceanicaulis sp.]|uniref:PAS domain-containing hybrid sensor histidine kinase/response regulator n=1 Tax=Glycocaulis sp. TaxID=1969725 RepID=UPI0025C3458E|nr:PAS domain S-box protein [Glycocaulis sp.]MCC5980899.1 PAS domain S-box protein [Oceanicaulis sp.]MCH8522540.1 PAS domain S-box protein [Glycocaulis sp.]